MIVGEALASAPLAPSQRERLRRAQFLVAFKMRLMPGPCRSVPARDLELFSRRSVLARDLELFSRRSVLARDRSSS
jgi:hypothetical protein